MTDKYFNMRIKNIENKSKIITIEDEPEVYMITIYQSKVD